MDRRSLLDGDATPTHERQNVFGDEFEIDDFDGVADGFRHNVDLDADAQSRQEDVTDHPEPTVFAHYATSPVTPTRSNGPSRNSTRKSRSYANPFASPEDDDTPQERPNSLEFEPDGLARRSTSSASSHVYASTNSPRFGAGPSHPYGAYQQGTVSRTLSVGTTSTIRPGPRQSYSQSRPQHPYALYPQGVDDDLDDDDDTVQMRQNPVPVGFPGLGQNYTRRLGPDGEDQDIIGEDGHTEQLPPYTRYPEDGPEKMPLLPTALHSRAPVAGTDPGMPLMHTTLHPTPTPQPPPQSMTDDSALERRASRASSHNLISSSSSRSGSSFDEKKPWKEKTWKEKRKTKICGIPFWWILLAAAVLTFIAAVLGGVIGGFVAGGNHARDKATVTVVTSLYDASLIASPTSGAPPTGTYALTLSEPEETQASCLPIQSQQVAWDCNLAPNPALAISVEAPGDGKGSGASVFYASNDTTIAYGAQLSYMNTGFAQFLTVQDNDDKSNGPAFYFQQFYDKVVVVPEQAIAVPTGSNNKKSKRGGYPPGFIVPEEWRHRKQVATPGDKPWFCVWNGTFLEGFIYVQQSIAISSSTTSSTSSTTPPANTSTPPTTPPPSTTSGYTPTPPTTPPPDVITTTITAPFTTATYTGPASGFNGWASERVEEAKRRFYGDHDSDDSHKKAKRQSASDLWAQMEVFPYIVKLEERRLPNNPQNPYCQQYQVLDSWSANWVADDNGQPIIVELSEDDPSYGAYESAHVAGQTKRTVPGGCHCQWMSGEPDSDGDADGD